MRRVILKMHVSLDGYARGAEGDVMDWIFDTYDDELQAWEVDMLWQAGVHIMGRKVYEEMAAYWPTSTEVYAPPMNEIPKVIFSKTVRETTWVGARIENGDLLEAMTLLRNEPGKEILAHGGPDLAQSLMRHDLIDEFRLLVHPVTLGGGLPLFTERTKLRLAGARAFPGGTVLMTYRSIRDGEV